MLIPRLADARVATMEVANWLRSLGLKRADMKDLSKGHQAGPHIMIFNPAAGWLPVLRSLVELSYEIRDPSRP